MVLRVGCYAAKLASSE